MSNAAKILVPTAVLGLLAVALLVVLPGWSDAPPAEAAQPPAREQAPPEAALPVAGAEEPATDERVEVVRRPAGEINSSGRDEAQGVFGIVVAPDQGPVVGAQVFLLESAINNPVARWRALQDGVQFPPAARAVTDANGRFDLGIRTATDTKYDVRVLSTAFADHTLSPVTIQAGDWIDAGVIHLGVGAVVRGRVTVEGTQVPVPGARVVIESLEPFDDLALASVPERAQGLSATVDRSGTFEFRNAPADTEVHISAVAANFARVRKTNVRLEGNRVNEIHFELPRGLIIAGLVTDGSGAGVPEATIVATAIGDNTPQREQSFSNRDGQFEVFGLRSGTFQLAVSARDFQTRVEQPIIAGSGPVRITLERKGLAQLKVVDPNDRTMSRYVVEVLRYFAANNGHLGRVKDVPEQHIRPSDLKDSVAAIGGIDDGTYVFQVRATGYAKTLSEPFEIGVGKPAPMVTVRLTLGATLRGTVVDELGVPVADATVDTQANGFADDNPLIRILGSMMPERITRSTARTDGQGSFEIPLLALGDYQLKVSHPDYCDHVEVGVRITEVGDREVPAIRLTRGALIRGITRVKGVPSGQVKVIVCPPTMVANVASVPPSAIRSIRVEAVSNSEGRFVIPRRLPPGIYEIRCAQELVDGGFFGQVLQFKKSADLFEVHSGQAEYNHDLNITPNP